MGPPVCLLSHSVIADSFQPHGLQPKGLLCPWESPGKSTGVGCHFLLQAPAPQPQDLHLNGGVHLNGGAPVAHIVISQEPSLISELER